MSRHGTGIGCPRQPVGGEAKDLGLDLVQGQVALEAEQPGLRVPQLAAVDVADEQWGEQHRDQRDDQEECADALCRTVAGAAERERQQRDEEPPGRAAHKVPCQHAAPGLARRDGHALELVPFDRRRERPVQDHRLVLADPRDLTERFDVPEVRAPVVVQVRPVVTTLFLLLLLLGRRLLRRFQVSPADRLFRVLVDLVLRRGRVCLNGEQADHALEEPVAVVGQRQPCKRLERRVRGVDLGPLPQ